MTADQPRRRHQFHFPSVSYTDHTWAAPDDGMTSRRKRREGSGTYRSAIPAPIAAVDLELPDDLAADAEEGAAQLARFDTYTVTKLGSGIDTLGPMSAVLLRTESSSSSQIEEITVGVQQLAMAELGEARSANAKTVLGNVHAMEAALSLADRLDTVAILEMHNALLRHQRGWADHAGRLREQPVWIGTRSPVTATFVPPQHPLVPGAMEDLVEFIDRDDLPVVAQAAVAHAQFETIHPFADGNGRVGRAIVHAILRNKQVTASTTAPVSAGLLHDTETYFDALGAYRRGDIRPIVERFSEASRFAASTGTRLVDDLSAELDFSRQQMHGVRPQAHAWSVLPHLVAHPVVNAKLLNEELGLNDMAAQRALATLTDRGILIERTGQSRNRVWSHPGIIGVLEDYAENIRRD